MSEFGVCEECGETLTANTIKFSWKKKLCKSVRCGVNAGVIEKPEFKSNFKSESRPRIPGDRARPHREDRNEWLGGGM